MFQRVSETIVNMGITTSTALLLLLSTQPCSSLLLSNRPHAYRLLISRYAAAESEKNNDGIKATNDGIEDDPRLFQKRIREEQLNAILQSRSKSDNIYTQKQQPRYVSPQQQQKFPKARKDVVKKRRQGEEASAAMDLPNQPMVSTIGGGTIALFDSIRKAVVPRWHPVTGVADINPQFRVESPAMTSTGYAASIWRNARKRQPSMWRYALRTFDRMTQQQKTNGPKLDIINTHYEGALVAASKLGWSQKAMEIYEIVERKQEQILERQKQQLSSGFTGGSGNAKITSSSSTGNKRSSPGQQQQQQPNTKIAIRITENMVLSVIRASVRDAMKCTNREPLDFVLQRVIYSIQDKHNIPVTSIHLNPIAAAYQSLGYTNDANNVLLGNLLDRIGGPEAENFLDFTTFNVNDVQAKDKGSYSLLVQSAVQEHDYGQAVQALKTMTEAGLYPTNRHLNIWTDVSNKRQSNKRRRDVQTTHHSL